MTVAGQAGSDVDERPVLGIVLGDQGNLLLGTVRVGDEAVVAVAIGGRQLQFAVIAAVAGGSALNALSLEAVEHHHQGNGLSLGGSGRNGGEGDEGAVLLGRGGGGQIPVGEYSVLNGFQLLGKHFDLLFQRGILLGQGRDLLLVVGVGGLFAAGGKHQRGAQKKRRQCGNFLAVHNWFLLDLEKLAVTYTPL